MRAPVPAGRLILHGIGRLVDKHKAASKDELLEMIRFGADTVSRGPCSAFVLALGCSGGCTMAEVERGR